MNVTAFGLFEYSIVRTVVIALRYINFSYSDFYSNVYLSTLFLEAICIQVDTYY